MKENQELIAEAQAAVEREEAEMQFEEEPQPKETKLTADNLSKVGSQKSSAKSKKS